MGEADWIQTEWRRLLARVRHHGPLETSEYLSPLIRNGGYPIWYVYKLTKYLIKRGQVVAAGVLLKAADESGEYEHPLMDHAYGEYLWACGEKKRAIYFTSKHARHWHVSYLWNLLAAMYKLSGDQSKAERYSAEAIRLGKQEKLRDQVDTTKSDKRIVRRKRNGILGSARNRKQKGVRSRSNLSNI